MSRRVVDRQSGVLQMIVAVGSSRTLQREEAVQPGIGRRHRDPIGSLPVGAQRYRSVDFRCGVGEVAVDGPINRNAVRRSSR